MKLKSDSRIAWALVGLFIAFYWATFGGHTYSSDEEMLYYVTEGIVERQSFVVPVQTPSTSLSTGARGVDGNNYAITGLLQSILAIPLYLLGKSVSEGFQPVFEPFWTRFFLCSFNGVVGGLTVGLMYILCRKFGFRRGTALFLAVGLGATTFLGIYARTFFSESLVAFWILLAVYAAYSYRITSQARWGIVWGAALGLAVATKPQALLSWPAFGLYALLILFTDYPDKRTRFRWFYRSLGCGLLGVIFPIVLVLAYNQARFGDIFQTGYPTLSLLSFAGPGFVALYGFVFGAGRSFFLYAPLCILSLAGIKNFFVKFKLESVLFVLLVASYFLFYAFFFAEWHGGGSWGPRYLSHIVPVFLLPAGAYLEHNLSNRVWRYCLSIALFILGFVIQFGAVVINYNTYYNMDFGPYSFYSLKWDAFLFHPSYSPATGHWKLWFQRYHLWEEYKRELPVVTPENYRVSGSFYDVEAPHLAPFGFWTSGDMTVGVCASPGDHVELNLSYWRPSAEKVPQLPVQYFTDGAPVEVETVITDAGEGLVYTDAVVVVVEHDDPVFEVMVPVWSPSIALGVSDGRLLGVFLNEIQVTVNDSLVPTPTFVANSPLIPPLRSVLEAYDWGAYATGWFWYPNYPNIMDSWWWYIGFIGEAENKVRVARWVGASIISSIVALSLLCLYPILVTPERRSQKVR